MGVLDFLSDLSKASKKDELGLGGMRSLLGTRGAAPKGKRGDEMMSRTSSDSLPGYFDPETREYVPWYVDLFDGGGLNKSEGLLSDAQKVTTAVDMLKTNGAPVRRAGQMAPGSDMPNTGMTGIPGYTLPQSDMPNTGMTGIPGYTLPQSDMPNTGMTGIPGYTLPQAPALAPAQQGTQVIPASGGNMAINTPAAQGRDQMIADQQMSNMEQAMRNHPLYPEYVDFLNRSNMPSSPSLFQQYVNMFGRN